MSKTFSGVMLIVGLLVASASIVTVLSTNDKKDRPELYSYYDALDYFIVGTAFIGLGMFVLGTMRFFRK